MVVLVDEARWPAHGRHWAHLVSDTSLEELHAFARATGVPPRSFDHDHYDVPDHLVALLVAAGAERVGARELVRRLVASGLRVPARARGAGSPPLPHPAPAGVLALVLAAGAGTRYGGPLRVVRGGGTGDGTGDGTGGPGRGGAADRPGAGGGTVPEPPGVPAWVARLRAAGCEDVLVVLGADADLVRPLLPAGVDVVVAERWADGMSASLRAGLGAAVLREPAAAAALVVLAADQPPSVDALARLVAPVAVPGPGGASGVLARAARGGRAAHPVLLGRQHWAAASAAATGDRAAGPYLRAAGAVLVEV